MSNIWVQKSRYELKRGRKGWHCKSYLEGIGSNVNERYPSGGRNSTKSPESMGYIRRIQTGDLVVIYQVDDDSIHAISQSESPGMEADKGSRQFNLFYLMPAARCFRLKKPLSIPELNAAGCTPKCFGPGTNGRIFPLTMEDFIGIVKAIAKTNPEQSEELSKWMRERSAK